MLPPCAETVNELKKTEEEIAYLASFPELYPDPIVEVDFKGNVTYVNPAAKDLFPNIKIMGWKHQFLHFLIDAAKQLKKKGDIVTLNVKAQGHWYFQRIYLVPNRHTYRVIASNIDLRMIAQQNLRIAQAKLQEYTNNLESLVEERSKELREKERMAIIGQTAGMVGHDIRNPLQAIVNELYWARELIQKAPPNENTREAIESIDFIQEQVDYVSKIVSDLQDFSRRTKPSLVNVDVKNIVDEAFSTVSIPNNIEAKCDIEPNISFKSDPLYIRRIITNLCTNAIQAMPKGGQLTIEARREECFVAIIVGDTGEGIPKEFQDQIFKPLFTTKAKGQGFGLAVVKKFIEELQGTIIFESQEGKGTKFIIELPIAQ